MSLPSHLKYQETTYEDYGAFYCPPEHRRLEPIGLPKEEIKPRGKGVCFDASKPLAKSEDATPTPPTSSERLLESDLAKNIDQVELHFRNKESIKLDVRKQ
ncbi:unnamed protein product [Dibothriocephalus latus]|uniref:Uncharacterized protein n=1 Tax=Dibothriocephalus latus TaxID=60516 RepID=A0A3P7L6G0_DIBLA|nr:unnamed protein product [Dibothriocephalus latus]